MGDAVMDFASLDTGAGSESTSSTSSQQGTYSGERESSHQERADSSQTRDVPLGNRDLDTDRDTQGQEEQQKLDGRRGRQQMRDAVKAAMEQFPDKAGAFKELRAAYFENGDYKKVFPTLADAANAKQLITDIGGIDGIAGMQQRIQQMVEQDTGLRDGNPKTLDPFFKDFPEGAAKLAPHYLERLAQSNPQALSDAVTPYALSLVDNAMSDYLTAKAQAGDTTAAEIKRWLDGQKGEAIKAIQQRQTPTPDPREAQITERERALQEKESRLYAENLNKLVDAVSVPETDKVAAQYASRYKLNAEFFSQQLMNKVKADMMADKSGFLTQRDIRKRAGATPEKMAEFISAEYNKRLGPTALELANSIFGKSAPKPAATASTATQQREPQEQTQDAAQPRAGTRENPIKVMTRPQNHEMKRDFPGYKARWIEGRGQLLNGKWVRWV